jgi:hypothetical protein
MTAKGAYDLGGSAQLWQPDSIYPLSCMDQYNACFGVFHLLPAVVPDISWPIPYIYSSGGVNDPTFISLSYVLLMILLSFSSIIHLYPSPSSSIAIISSYLIVLFQNCELYLRVSTTKILYGASA